MLTVSKPPKPSMYCTHCKIEIKRGHAFCNGCGTPLAEEPSATPDDGAVYQMSWWDPTVMYLAIRGACAPPMVKLGSLEVGDLWFYDGLSADVTACVGDKTVLVAYDSGRHLKAAAAKFREGHTWLCGERPAPPDNFNFLVFAAREEPSGTLLVRCFKRGDWMGFAVERPLPPLNDKDAGRGFIKPYGSANSQ